MGEIEAYSKKRWSGLRVVSVMVHLQTNGSNGQSKVYAYVCVCVCACVSVMVHLQTNGSNRQSKVYACVCVCACVCVVSVMVHLHPTIKDAEEGVCMCVFVCVCVCVCVEKGSFATPCRVGPTRHRGRTKAKTDVYVCSYVQLPAYSWSHNKYSLERPIVSGIQV